MTNSEAKAIVTVSMVWLGVLIIASQGWIVDVRNTLAQKTGGTSSGSSTPTPAPIVNPSPTPSLAPSGNQASPVMVGPIEIPQSDVTRVNINNAPSDAVRLGGGGIGLGIGGFANWIVTGVGNFLGGFKL